MNISSPSPATMKPPHVRSIPLIPNLLDVDPFEDFEFSFPCEDLWWDDHDTATSDYFSDDDEDYSAPPSSTKAVPDTWRPNEMNMDKFILMRDCMKVEL